MGPTQGSLSLPETCSDLRHSLSKEHPSYFFCAVLSLYLGDYAQIYPRFYVFKEIGD